ncbi:MAG: PIG-L deacetylase family protein [Nitrospirota bacterium]
MNVLAIGAHFDDVEIGCGGTLAKHRANGDKVIVQVITHSKYADNNGNCMREKQVAFREGKKAARILDCRLICNNYETKHVQFGFKLISDIEEVIEKNRIDIIYTHWDLDVHQDHQAIGKATLAAGRKINSVMMYQSNLYSNSQQFNANYYVDISDYIDRKVAAIKAHRTEVEKFGAGWIEFWINEAMNNGKRFNVRYAEAYQLVKMLV